MSKEEQLRDPQFMRDRILVINEYLRAFEALGHEDSYGDSNRKNEIAGNLFKDLISFMDYPKDNEKK